MAELIFGFRVFGFSEFRIDFRLFGFPFSVNIHHSDIDFRNFGISHFPIFVYSELMENIWNLITIMNSVLLRGCTL